MTSRKSFGVIGEIVRSGSHLSYVYLGFSNSIPKDTEPCRFPFSSDSLVCRPTRPVFYRTWGSRVGRIEEDESAPSW